MKQTRALLIFGSLIVFLMISNVAHAQQPWSGIIDPSRAVDWSGAGVIGGIHVRTTQCGATIAPYSGSAAAINSAIAACPANQFVSLGAGTFNLSSGITFGGKSNVTLRGQGANATSLVFTGAGAGGYNSLISLEGSVSAAGFEQNVCDWTAGYSTGTTVVTLANCGTTTPAAGSLGNVQVGTLLVFDQLDEAADTGTIWNCAATGTCATTSQGGDARTDGTCNGAMCTRSQQQGVIVTGVSGNNITISPGIYMPNWRSGQKPQVQFANTTITLDGLENLTFDNTNCGTCSTSSVMVSNCSQCWVSGVRGIYANRSHIHLLGCVHCTLQENYFYKNASGGTVSYGLDVMSGWNNLIVSNIFQQDTDSSPSCTGSCGANVIAYNFAIDNTYTSSPGWMQASLYQHASGDDFNLWEGNIGAGFTSDDTHGTHHFDTLFRNYLIGNQPAGCGSAGLITCTAETTPVHLDSGSRYFNVIGNVLGQAGLHNNYQCVGFFFFFVNASTEIYTAGTTGDNGLVNTSITGYCLQPACTTLGDYDPQVLAYLMRWGNYDTVNNAVRFVSAEVPSGIAQFSNAVPATQTLPPSFYLSSKPAWFGSLPFPAMGPDVTGGNISGVGGHANENPAMACYLGVMGGPTAGTGSVLGFDASVCYGSHAGPAPPTNLSIIVQ